MEKSAKTVLVSFSSRGREDYNRKLLRLLDSAEKHWTGAILVYSPDHELENYRSSEIHRGWPQPKGLPSFIQEEMPYQFKYALIQEAIERGFERVVWLDTSMELCGDITTLFGETGITVFENLGHDLLNYISDDAMRQLNVTAAELAPAKQIWGGALLFDFTKLNAQQVWRDIKEFCVNGSFKNGGSTRPGFVAHRHDQAVLSVLTRNRCDMLPYGVIKSRSHFLNGEYGPNEECKIIYS